MKRLGRRSLLLVVLLLVLQLCIGATAVSAGYHLVRAGDTLYSLGRLYGVNPYTIAAENGLADPNYLYIGQMLYIPVDGGTPPPAPPQYSYPPDYWYWWNYWYAQNYWWYYHYWHLYPYGWDY